MSVLIYILLPMKKNLPVIITSLVVIALIVLGFVFAPPVLSERQLETLMIVGIICGCSAAYCFIVGEITRNNSQMDKLWSLLPIAYAWVIAWKGDYKPRLVLFAVIATLWGIRLTTNFARKGAYSLKFWSGEEDYRWKVLREKPGLKSRPVWALFDLFFISIYQNALVLAICIPSLVAMDSDLPLGAVDYIAASAAFLFLLIEAIADEQQMAFHTTKRRMLVGGKSLNELPAPFDLGFNTTGLWSYCRHPNYLGEQGIWMSLYFFAVGAGACAYGVFSFSMIGPLLLIFLFLGSSAFGEGVSAGKYPEYADYQRQVFKYFPVRKYHRLDKAE